MGLQQNARPALEFPEVNQPKWGCLGGWSIFENTLGVVQNNRTKANCTKGGSRQRLLKLETHFCVSGRMETEVGMLTWTADLSDQNGGFFFRHWNKYYHNECDSKFTAWISQRCRECFNECPRTVRGQAQSNDKIKIDMAVMSSHTLSWAH